MIFLRLSLEVCSLISMSFSAYAIISWNHVHFRYSALVDALTALVQLGLVIAEPKCKSTGYLAIALTCDFILMLLLVSAAVATTTRIYPCFNSRVYVHAGHVYYIFFKSFCHKLQALVAFQYVSFFLEALLMFRGIIAFHPSQRKCQESCNESEKSHESDCEEESDKIPISKDKHPSFGPPVRLDNFDFTLA